MVPAVRPPSVPVPRLVIVTDCAAGLAVPVVVENIAELDDSEIVGVVAGGWVAASLAPPPPLPPLHERAPALNRARRIRRTLPRRGGSNVSIPDATPTETDCGECRASWLERQA